MFSGDSQIIIEGTILSRKGWCEKFNIIDSEFEELLNLRILLQADIDSFRNTFVGSIKLKKNLFYSIPKCFAITENSEGRTVRQIIELVEKSLVNYKKRIDKSKAIQTDENYYLSIRYLTKRTEFDLYLTLKDLYLKKGLYRKRKNSFTEGDFFNAINWPRTISRSQSIYSNDNPVYVKPISSIKSFEENKITILHLSVLSYLSKKYHFFEYNSNLPALLKSENIEYQSINEIKKDSSNWCNILNTELRRTYKDELKELLLLLKEFLSEEGYKTVKTHSFFGTSYYYLIWEDALKVGLHDQYEKFKDRFGQPVYRLLANTDRSFTQEPDILLEKDESFFILDAKYYILEKSKPGCKDIVKQLFYLKSFMPEKSYEKIENYFLVPLLISMEKENVNTSNTYLGEVSIEFQDSGLQDFKPVKIIGLNPINVLINYVQPQSSDRELFSISQF